MSSRLTVAGAARVVPAKSKANIAHIERMSESHPLHGMGLAYTHQQSQHLPSETEADNSSKDVNKASGGLARVNAWAIASFRLATRQLRHYACRRDGPRECLLVMKSTRSLETYALAPFSYAAVWMLTARPDGSDETPHSCFGTHRTAVPAAAFDGK